MREQTRAKWAERIRAWRASGLSAEAFTSGKDYEASGLRWAMAQFAADKAREAGEVPAPRKAMRSGRTSGSSVRSLDQAPRFVQVGVRSVEAVGAEMVVEVGGARIRVTRGVDVALLCEVVRTLQGGGR
jgi:hypothetical protein